MCEMLLQGVRIKALSCSPGTPCILIIFAAAAKTCFSSGCENYVKAHGENNQ